MRYLLSIVILTLLLATGFNAAAQSPLKLRDTTISGPQTFAFVIGISKYKYIRPLAYADKDAELFRDYLKSPGGGSLKDDNIFCLLNDQAINSNFWGKGFQWLKAKQLQKGDRLFIYLAGHGDAIDEDQFFFLGYDCNPEGDKNNYLVSGAIQLFNLKKKIAKETTKGVEVFFIMDACRSNELPGGSAGQNFLNVAISEKKVGDIMMLATAAGQESLEDASIGNGHGLFTYYLVDGLSGVADTDGTPDNKITFKEIKSFVDKNVPSLALQRFKKKQDPYFCCTEFNENVVSRVDTAYLQKWLKTKKQQTRGGGNSAELFEASGVIKRPAGFFTADTVLIETYNLFYKAVKSNNLSGKSSAEEYFQQLDKKYPGNPYTLDAKSTLAVEYINVAQRKVDRYLGCGDEGSSKEKQANYEAAINLEKAITLVREDDEDFANSLLNRMYLLKASGDFGNGGKNGDIAVAFQNAHAALAIDPTGAYILNKLALLHLENYRADSAVYYADKAIKAAPNWACALTTLALAQKKQANNTESLVKTKRKDSPKLKPGIMLGAGLSMPAITYTKEEWRQGNINYNDSLFNITASAGEKFDLGITGYLSLGKSIAVRPAVQFVFEGGEIVYERKNPAGAPFSQRKKTERIAVNIPVPFIIRFSQKNIDPFLSIGPAISFSLNQYNGSEATPLQIPMKSFDFLGEAGFGIDIRLKKSGLLLSPELRYSHGFNNIKGTGNSLYLNTFSSLKKNAFTFSFYLRKM
jgi:hypothetical protein